MLDKARLAGALYLALSIAGVFSVLYVPSVVIVRGDAAATAARIADAALLFRIGIAADLFASILFLFLVWTLYQLLESVDRKLALLMVMLVSVSAGMSIFNLVNKIAPLVLASGAGFLSVFPKPQLDALALAFLRLHDNGLEIIS